MGDADTRGGPAPGASGAIAAAELLCSPACLIDRDGKVAHLNAAWRALAGSRAARDGLHWTDLLGHAARETAQARLREAAATAGKAELECELATDATPHAFLLTLHPVDDPPARWLCIATDIQALRHREYALERRESALAAMLDVSVDCIKVIDLDGNLVRVNRAGALALGVPERPAPGTRWLPLLAEDVRVDGQAALAQARQGKPGRFPGRSTSPDGATQHWDNLLTPLFDAHGRPSAILCVSRDVSAEHAGREHLRESEQRLAIAARIGGLGIWDYDIVNDTLYCDPSWYRIMGREGRPPIRSIDEFRPFVHPDDVAMATEVQRTAAELVDSQRDYSVTFRIVRPDGEVRWVRSLAYLQHQDGVPVRAVGFVTDVTDALHGELALRDANRALEVERRSLARKVLEDPLTGIANRRHLDKELAHACARAEDSGQPLCIGMIDVDRFKQFNDRYGHLEGDVALRKVALMLQAVAGPSNLVARYGGEEFTFVLPGTADPEPFLRRFADALVELAIPHADSPTGLLTTSCGAIIATGPRLSPAHLLKAGDEALYEAKLRGRDCHVIRVVGA